MSTPELSSFPHRSDDHHAEAENFLDLMNADMDFEQAFSMYSNLQQKNAMSGVEQLQKVQKLNEQFISQLNSPPPVESDVPSFNGSLNQLAPPVDALDHHNNNFTFDPPSLDKFEFQRHDKPFLNSGPQEYDQFFSNTESDALEKFLDNLANPTANPLLIYNHGVPTGTTQPLADLNSLYDLHTMKSTVPPTRHHSNPLPHFNDNLKQELNDAFGYPQRPVDTQLPTPMDSRQLSSSLFQKTSPKRPYDYSDDLLLHASLSTPPSSSPLGSLRMAKKQKKTQRPLLSLEQKRLNHSHSEQKRRQLCKTAYDRCLRLVTNIHDYHMNDEAQTKMKLKRRQMTKDGLPNLSKHTALMKISGEICKLKQKNDKIKQLLGV